jgi:hypothetical protein
MKKHIPGIKNRFRWWHLILGIYALGAFVFLVVFLMVNSSPHDDHDGPCRVIVRKVAVNDHESTFTPGGNAVTPACRLKCMCPESTQRDSLPVLILYPATFLQERNFSMLARRMASHGFFVVICGVKVNSFWGDLFHGRWQHLSWKEELHEADVLMVLNLLKEVNRSDPEFKGKLSLAKVGVATRINLAIPFLTNTASCQEGNTMSNGVWLARFNFVDSTQIEDGRLVMIPFNRASSQENNVDADPGLFNKLILVVRNQLSSQRLIPFRMAQMLIDRIKAFSGRSYINISESIMMYFV